MKELRSLVVKLVIGSFSIAALLGIIALLAGGSFGDTEGRILLTTVVVGVTSIAALCYLSTADKPFQLVGVVGGAVSLVPFALALWMTWNDSYSDHLWRIFGIGITVAASLAQASLLLALAYDSRPIVRRLLLATLSIIGVVAVLIIIPLATQNGMSGDYWRIFGVVAILDTLGTVTVAALQKFVPVQPKAERPNLDRPNSDSPNAGIDVNATLDARIAAAANERGVSRTQLLSEALDKLLGPGS